MDFRKKYWIRRDRERFFFIGFTLIAAASCFATTWWNFSDRIKGGRIVMRKQAISRQKEAELLREQRLTPGGSKLLDIGRALEQAEARDADK